MGTQRKLKMVNCFSRVSVPSLVIVKDQLIFLVTGRGIRLVTGLG